MRSALAASVVGISLAWAGCGGSDEAADPAEPVAQEEQQRERGQKKGDSAERGDPLVGTWEGEVSDPYTEEPYRTTVRITRAGSEFAGRTKYEGYDCTGRITGGTSTGERTYRLTEAITRNTDSCGDEWAITVTLRSGRRSDWEWRNAEGHTAGGQLERAR